MNKYKEFELSIFNWLKSKNETDTNFTFSVRQKANKGAELNYFIGTETSKYFSTTFWNIPVAYPGSSSDLINLVFGFDSNNNYVYAIQFNQTKNPESEQNELALQLIRNCKTTIKSDFDRFYENDASSKMEFFRINGKLSYSSIQELIIDANADIEKVIPIVDIEIEKLKKAKTKFKAHRFTIQEQIKMFEKMEIRFKKYKNIGIPIVLVDDEDEIVTENHSKSDIPLNQILYGPPGTGKTYNSINKAISIINPDFEISSDRNLVKKEYEKLVNEGNVSFCTFHQSMSYEDFIEGIKPIKPEEEDKFIKYQVESGIFKMACANAAYLCYKKYKSKNQKNSEYNFDELHDAFINHIQELMDNNTPPVYKTLKGKDVTVIKITSTNSIKARALNSKATRNPAPLTKENLEKLYDKFSTIDEIKSLKQVEETVEVTPRITEFYAVFKALKEFEKNDFKPDVEYQEEMNDIETIDINEKLVKFEAGVYTNAIKQYGKVSEPVVLIIDEINRGNVSQIFGELITLIEEDKRMGNEESLEVLLPYSKKKFGVPPNLYIIGTMNTADRSVEALDTALRRRFSFEEMLPNSKVVEEKGFNDYLRKEVMEKINNRIELLLDRNHTLGHAYFIKENFENSFENEIIPLLQEYFYNDYGKIGLVLGKGFVREKSISATRDKTIFADFETKNEVDIVKSYELIPFEQVDFKTAITTLLG